MKEIIHNREESRFVLPVEDGEAIIDYTIRDGVYYLNHSEVPRALRRQGVGKILVHSTMDYLTKLGVRVRPVCSYVKAVVQRSGQWDEILN